MLKKICLAVATLAVAAVSVFALSACDTSTLPRAIRDNISELRTNIFSSPQSADVISVITGMREEPYKIDGISGELREFSVITFSPAAVVPGVEYTYRLTADGREFTGRMEIHPMGNSYSADIGVMLEAQEITIVISRAGFDDQTFTLAARFNPQTMISWEEAVETTMETLAEPLAVMYDGTRLTGEVFVRLSEEPQGAGNTYWYVSFNNGRVTVAALVDARTGQVVASRSA